jgi:hypothetical protein
MSEIETSEFSVFKRGRVTWVASCNTICVHTPNSAIINCVDNGVVKMMEDQKWNSSTSTKTVWKLFHFEINTHFRHC